MKERLLRLEHENKKLRGGGGGGAGAAGGAAGANSELLQTMVDDLKERETQLQVSEKESKNYFGPLKLNQLGANFRFCIVYRVCDRGIW